MPDALEQRLGDLAGDLAAPVPDGLEAAVMRRVVVARPRRRLRRWVAGLLLGVLGVGVVASPVGASLREWLGLPGVTVESGEPVTGTPTVPPASGRTSLEQAAARAGFVPVVSLSWSTEQGTVRIDQFRGVVEPLFWKTTDKAERVTVAGQDALWLPTAHRVEVVSDDGSVRSIPSRLAAPTLLWLADELTLRLEGELSLADATRIAESVG